YQFHSCIRMQKCTVPVSHETPNLDGPTLPTRHRRRQPPAGERSQSDLCGLLRARASLAPRRRNLPPRRAPGQGNGEGLRVPDTARRHRHFEGRCSSLQLLSGGSPACFVDLQPLRTTNAQHGGQSLPLDAFLNSLDFTTTSQTRSRVWWYFLFVLHWWCFTAVFNQSRDWLLLTAPATGRFRPLAHVRMRDRLFLHICG